MYTLYDQQFLSSGTAVWPGVSRATAPKIQKIGLNTVAVMLTVKRDNPDEATVKIGTIGEFYFM
jgi:hypothetical protein